MRKQIVIEGFAARTVVFFLTLGFAHLVGWYIMAEINPSLWTEMQRFITAALGLAVATFVAGSPADFKFTLREGDKQ